MVQLFKYTIVFAGKESSIMIFCTYGTLLKSLIHYSINISTNGAKNQSLVEAQYL